MLLAMLAVGCSGDAPTKDTGCVSAYGLTWDGWAQGFMTTYCQACHSADSPDRRGAPADANFDTLEDVLSWSELIRTRVIEEQTMPVGGGILEDDLLLLEDFLDCPELP